MTSLYADVAGPAIHARTLLGDSPEPLLWAAAACAYGVDNRPFEAAGRPQVNFRVKPDLGKRALDALLDFDSEEGDGGAPDRPTPDVVIVGRDKDALAMRYALRLIGYGDHLWVLTPNRLHIAIREQPPLPAPPPPPPEPAKKSRWGILGDIVEAGVEVGKDAAAALTKPIDKLEPSPEVRALTPVLDVPRTEIAGFSVAARGFAHKRSACLRMQLVDGSGFDLFFGAGKEPDQYERLLALTNGAPE
ncbi:hypothetical protein [Actinokineospora sp. NBRC 105648]|uniref:hypothetical protein n=1 Tax=Actinokineospora sp. NBRC 105648 TaxID=3032206 RepID=UPI0024A336FD|nr:hypothetical protein [Actinokineospora sp. NBRC 105648]GLZ40652.1 hypothetical protein Acsp05_42760 [Actinokineospora sp. NBRC 105648]